MSPYGAKGDGATDDTSAITSAINAACANTVGSGVVAHPDVIFPPGVYFISQPQGGTAPALPMCSALHLVGMGAATQGTAIPRPAAATILVGHPGSSPTATPVFAVVGPENGVTIENLNIEGHNQALSLFATYDVTLKNVCLSTAPAATSQADNTPLKISNTIEFYMYGGCLQGPSGNFTLPTALFTGETPILGEAPLVGLAFMTDVTTAGGGFQYIQRVNTVGSGPGNFVFRNVIQEDAANDFFAISNATGNPGSTAMATFTSITFDHVEQSDSNAATNAVISLNSTGSVLSGVYINHSYAGNGQAPGNGAAIRILTGSLNSYQVTGCQVVCVDNVMDGSGNPIGDGARQSFKGWDFVTDTTDAARLNSGYFDAIGNVDATPARFFKSGSPYASLAIDPAAGVLFGTGATFGFNSQIDQTTAGDIDVAFATAYPPTSVTATPTTGGTLAAGTYYYYVYSTTIANCTTNFPTYFSAPSLVSTAAVVSGSNNAVTANWTAAPSTGTGTIVGYCVFRTTQPGVSVFSDAGPYVAGASSASVTDIGSNWLGTVYQNPVSTMQTQHRFTPHALGVNTASPQYNLDVAGSAAVNSLNSVQMADRAAGSDTDARINACLTAASTTSGVCDARGLAGTLTGTSHIAIPAGTTLLWGVAQLTISDSSTNDAVELLGDGAALIGYQESGLGTVSRADTSGYIACGIPGCTTVDNPNAASRNVDWIHISGMYLLANGSSSTVLNLTSVGHSDIENNRIVLGTGGNSYGIFGDTSTGDHDSTNTLIKHNEIDAQTTGDTCSSLAGIFNAVVLEQNSCYLPPGASIGFQFQKDSNGNYPNNDEFYGNDCETGSQAFNQICYNIVGAQSVTIGPNNRCENVYNCFQFPADGSAVGIHVLDPYLSLSNNTQIKPNEPAAAMVAIDNNGHNWTPSMHFGMNDLGGPNLLGNANFEGWQTSTTLDYWAGSSGTNINQAGTGIYAQETSAGSNPAADSFTQGTYNVRVGDGATAGLGIHSGCIQVDATFEYTLMFRVASASTSNTFRPGFRFYSDPNCTEADRLTSQSSNARVLIPANYAGYSSATANYQSTNASLTYNNGITCNCNVTGSDWSVSAANAWTPSRNYGITFRVPNAYGSSSTITHSMRVFLIENTAAAGNYMYFDDVILSQGPVTPDFRPAPLYDAGNGGMVNGYANYNFAGNVSLGANTGFTGTLTHANTANRTYTMPDATGPVIVQTGSTPANNDCAQFSVSGSTVSVKDGGTGCPAVLASWGLQHAGGGQAFSSNAVKVWGVVIPYAVGFAHLDYDVTTLDSSTSDFYDVGLYGPCAVNTSSCPLVTHIGATNLTATGYKQASVTSGTIQPGTYWIAITANATTAQTGTTSVSEWSVCPSTNSSTTSSGGVLPSTIATPNCSAPQWTGATVLSIGLE